MTPTLSPQQREEVLEAMARAFRPVTSSDGSHTARFSTEEEIRNGWKAALGPSLDAALPAIIGAVLERAADLVERRAWIGTIAHARYEMAAALRALAEEAR